MATVTKIQDFSEQLIRGVHDFDAHTFKVALTNTAPLATNTVLADITQIAGTNGYTTGGRQRRSPFPRRAARRPFKVRQ